jgi:hypothetical protein
MTSLVYILGALLLGFIAFKVLMGVLRIGVIVLILGALAVAYSQGAFG